MIFIFDRYEAGKLLAKKLLQYKDTDAVVCALPRGGVLTGYEIGAALHLPLDIIITRKVGHPFNLEVAICALSEDGTRVCNDHGLCGVDSTWIENESAIALQEAHDRRTEYQDYITPQSVTGKTVILVDDGIATGLTIKAAIATLKTQKPKRIVVAVPMCPKEIKEELASLVDEVVLLIDDEPQYRGSVSAYYTYFPQIFNKEVIECLKSARHQIMYKKVAVKK